MKSVVIDGLKSAMGYQPNPERKTCSRCKYHRRKFQEDDPECHFNAIPFVVEDAGMCDKWERTRGGTEG